MNKGDILVTGGEKLYGELTIQGSKNTVLPMMAAALLCKKPVILTNVPEIEDVHNMAEIIRQLGCQVLWENHVLTICAQHLSTCEISATSMGRLRSSVCLLAPLLCRTGWAVLPRSGGCQIGARPIDIHLSGLRSLGVKITEDEGVISAYAEKMTGNEIYLRFPSVGATENLTMAAICAEGATCLMGVSREPEVIELCHMLRQMGADIRGAGGDTIIIYGQTPLHGTTWRVEGDRIAAATYLFAGAGCGGNINIKGIYTDYLKHLFPIWEAMGAELRVDENSISLKREGRLVSPGKIVTQPYPGFPTDLQPILAAVCTRAEGETTIIETVFENRFLAVKELQKMDANLKIDGNCVTIKKIDILKAGIVCECDLRGGAAMVIAGLMAAGTTHILNCQYIFRGYEKPVEIFKALGGKVEMMT